MSLRPCSETCQTFAKELAASLSKEDLAEPRAEFEGKSWQEWLDWRREHQEIVMEYITMPPSMRRRRREWQEPKLRRRLSLAATQHCFEACALIRTVESFCWQNYWETHREIAAQAGRSFPELIDEWASNDFFQWPFKEESPFMK